MFKLSSCIIGSFPIVLIVICLVRTYSISDIVISKEKSRCINDNIALDDAWERLVDVVEIPTWASNPINECAFQKLLNYLLNTYKDVFDKPFINYDIINRHSLLINITGSRKDLAPYLLMANLDVSTAANQKRLYVIDNTRECMDGAGVVDNKLIVVSILETLKNLKSQPANSFFVSFGHDKYIGHGQKGSAAIATVLCRRGVKNLSFVVAGGYPVFKKGSIPGLNENLALIGVSETGELNINISTSRSPVVGRVAKAVASITSRVPIASIDEITRNLIHEVGSFMKFPYNLVARNQWMFEPIIKRFMEKRKEVRDLIEMSSVTHHLQSFVDSHSNTNSFALIRHHVNSESCVKQILAEDLRLINDLHINVSLQRDRPSYDPHPVTDPKSRPYQLVKDIYHEIFPKTIILPAVITMATDARYFLPFTDHVIRVRPIFLESSDYRKIQTKEERLSKSNFARSLRFYRSLITKNDHEEVEKKSCTKAEFPNFTTK